MDKAVYTPDPHSDEVDLLKLLKRIWATRICVLLASLAFIAIFAGLLASKVSNEKASYSQLIAFTFKGIEEGKYPNGDAFRLGDILAPSIINAAYEDLNLSSTEFALNELTSDLRISPYSPEREFIIQKYSSIINSKDRSDEDKAQARNNMANELKNALNASAKIEFSNKSGLLTDQQALELVSKIPKLWAQQAIFVRGVTKHEITLISPAVIRNSVINTQQPLQQLTTLWSYFNILKDDLVKISQLSSATTVRDSETDLTISDLQTLLESLERQFVETPAGWTYDHEGPLSLNKGLYSPRLFDLSLVENLDYLVAVDVLAQRTQLVQSNLDSLKAAPFSSIVSDPKTGLTINDLGRLLDDMKTYDLQQLRAPLLELGISKDASRVPLYYNFRIKELERERIALNQQVQAIQKAENRYILGGAGQTTEPSTGVVRNTTNSQLGQTTTLIPQLGDAFLDKIIAMSEKGGDIEYRQDLNKNTINLEQQAIEIEKKINELQEYLNLFSDAQKSQVDKKLKDEYLTEIKNEFPESLEKLSSFAEISQRISNRLRYATEIGNVFSESKYKLDNDVYLQNINLDQSTSLKDIQNSMASYASTAQRIIDKIDSDRYGVVNDLYRYLNEPQAIVPKLISKRDILTFVTGLFAIIILTMLSHLAYQVVRDKE